jgi:ribonuclease-3
LGDSVLGLIVSDFLYQSLPEEAEGELSHLRAFLVGAECCAEYMQMLEVGQWVLLGRGEQMNEGRGRETIHADLLEAIIGAIYVDGGLEAAKAFFLLHFSERLQRAMKSPQRNWKAELQDYSQKRTQQPPIYRVTGEEGPDHNKCFSVEVLVADRVVGSGKGSSKKQAEQEAAQAALKELMGG